MSINFTLRTALGLLLLVPLPAQPQGDGCGFLTRAELEQTAGSSMRRARPANRELMGVQSTGCTYSADDWGVVVHVETGRTESGARQYMRQLRGVVKQTTGASARAVRGLGNEAWWGPINPTNGMLTVRRGADIIWVQTRGKGRGFGTLETTRALTDKVFARYAAAR